MEKIDYGAAFAAALSQADINAAAHIAVEGAKKAVDQICETTFTGQSHYNVIIRLAGVLFLTENLAKSLDAGDQQLIQHLKTILTDESALFVASISTTTEKGK